LGVTGSLKVSNKTHFVRASVELKIAYKFILKSVFFLIDMILNSRTVHKGEIDTGEMTVNNLATFCQE
jgi:hypothetical protein